MVNVVVMTAAMKLKKNTKPLALGVLVFIHLEMKRKQAALDLGESPGF